MKILRRRNFYKDLWRTPDASVLAMSPDVGKAIKRTGLSGGKTATGLPAREPAGDLSCRGLLANTKLPRYMPAIFHEAFA